MFNKCQAVLCSNQMSILLELVSILKPISFWSYDLVSNKGKESLYPEKKADIKDFNITILNGNCFNGFR